MSRDDSKQRFSNRVADYTAGRPTYPQAVIEHLSTRIGFDPKWNVLDVGAGTGISSKLFLDNDNPVTATEPNTPMRQASEAWLAGYPNYRSIDAPAESIPLPDHSIDLVVAAQAFHWFDPERFAVECRRLITTRGAVALIWNMFQIDATPAAVEYQKILREYALDLDKVANKWRESDLLARTWFSPDSYSCTELRNDQTYNFDELISRVASSSYMPPRDHPRFDEMVESYRAFFDRHAADARLSLPCICKVYLGKPREEIQ